jgi:single-strand DNA-binding protein
MTNAGQTYTTTGLVATTPRYLKTMDGTDICSFRLASGYKRFDRTKMEWIDAETNWLTITAFGTLAINVASSISKGDRIIISGTLRVRDWDNGEKTGTSVEVEADTIGHDLVWGQSTFTRTTLTEPKPIIRPVSVPKEEPAIV